MKPNSLQISPNLLPPIIALYFLVVINLPIAQELFRILTGLEAVKIGFVISIPLFLFAAFQLIFQLLNWPKVAKPIIAFLLISSSMVSYAMLSYGVYVDYGMIENLFETNQEEAASYLSLRSIIWVGMMGFIPALLLFLTRLTKTTWRKFLLAKLAGILGSVLLAAVIAVLYYQDYVSVVRNSPHLKKMIIPTEYLISTTKYLNNTYLKSPVPYQQIGLDARLKPEAKDASKPTLLVFVLGETARVFNYAYYGYERDTNVHTRPYDPIFFADVQSCGTATAVSVPCMFSNMNRPEYSKSRAYNQDNVVDIMARAGIQALWREHDGGDKGVAHTIREKTLVPHDADHLCNQQKCYDTAMLEDFADDTTNLTQDSVLFYHISGSHGPTYYKRYPKAHRAFTPDCPRSDIENCTHEELVNSYDNTILFTDFFLAEAIRQLKALQDQYHVALLYISDHGESLGENGVYLHGMPYALAPKEQTQVPMLFWASPGFAGQKGLDLDCLRQRGSEDAFSHDNLFDSLLGLMDVATEAYSPSQDIFALCRE
ncbi:phosphoethanolamine transferase [Ferrimonas marina]|uniref:Lipid A ethanolaminephosphotransferase n=1 Tax=Ferrimonas marina TaxID=299255 RepID=A0A1M5Z6D6_9GAMM|nr:phosphoethanolamine--lipid A transferase [Ferrimonas marina]SHI19453.1 lipid A ethanolaminephosphotransferase [Ferrimonas marina]